MTNPSTTTEWLSVSKERSADADAIVKSRATSIGSVYMAGYAIECSLKALLQARGTGFPKHGSQGHNLLALWEKSGFRRSDLADSTGTKTFFINNWDASLRYEESWSGNFSPEELVKGAKQLTGWIQQKIRNPRKGRKRQ